MVYRFGLFEFDAASGELRLEGRRVPLEPQPARALALLASRAGKIVTREEMRASIWSADTHVDFDRGLAYCVAQLRTALRDSGDNPRFIQTLPRRGFKFIAPVTVASAPETPEAGPAVAPVQSRSSRVTPWVIAGIVVIFTALAGAWLSVRSSHAPRRPIVAVAVFDNETGDPRYDRAVQQLSDVTVQRLTVLGPDRLGVIGNVATLRAPRAQRDLAAIARETRAAFIILGQLQPKDKRLSLLLQLIRVDDGTHVWVTRLNRPADEPLTNLDEEAAALVETAVRKHVLNEARSS